MSSNSWLFPAKYVLPDKNSVLLSVGCLSRQKGSGDIQEII